MQNQKSHIRILEEEESRGSRPSGDYEAAEAWEGIRI